MRVVVIGIAAIVIEATAARETASPWALRVLSPLKNPFPT